MSLSARSPGTTHRPDSAASLPVARTPDDRRIAVAELPGIGPLPGAVPCARLHTRLVLAERGVASLTEPAEIIVSELVTNAVAVTQRLKWIPTPPVQLWLLADSTQVLIAVWDANPCLPTRTEVDELTESGRGLLLVESLATHWDAYPTPHDGGKVVHALCALSQPRDG